MSYMQQLLAFLCLTLAIGVPVAAQPAGWTQPFPGHRVIGNLYAVGTYDLGVFLVTSSKGHFLINTGLDDSTPLIRRNVESLGFRLEDVKILLTMQAHWGHTAALAEIKEMIGAEMWATAGDAPVLEDGGFSDPHFGGKVSFKPVKVDRIIKDGEVIKLGDKQLTVVETPRTHDGKCELCDEGKRRRPRLRRRDREYGYDQRRQAAGGRSDVPRCGGRFRRDVSQAEGNARRSVGRGTRLAIRLTQ